MRSYNISILALFFLACSPGKKITQGNILYQIESSVSLEFPAGTRQIKHEEGAKPDTFYTDENQIRSIQNTYEREILFDSQYLREPAFEFSDFFEEYIQTHRTNRRRFKYMSFGGKCYAIEIPIQKENIKVIPLKGTRRIAGYRCKRAILKTEDREVEVYYTSRIGNGFTPLGPGLVDGCVLKYIEHPSGVRKSYVIEGEKELVSRAIRIEAKLAPNSFQIQTPCTQISEAEFQQLVSGFSPEQLSPGTKAAEINLTDLTEKVILLADFKDQHVLLYFWQEQNEASRSALATFQSFQKLYPTVQLLSLTTDRVDDPITFIRFHQLIVPTIPVAASVFSNYKLREIPSTVLINPQGIVVESLMGADQSYEQRLSDLLDRHLTTR